MKVIVRWLIVSFITAILMSVSCIKLDDNSDEIPDENPPNNNPGVPDVLIDDSVDSVNSLHYNARYSGRSYTAKDPRDQGKGHPLYNSYSKWIHQRSHGAYGFSLDDDEGLKACQSPTVNTVACPVCVPDASGKNCKLPSKSLPDPISKVTLIPADSEVVNPTRDTQNYKPAESYLTPSWLTLSKFDASKGSIDTDFSAFPDNRFYVENVARNREHPFHIAFNVANQSGLPNSTCRMKTPIWVTIDVGSPNLILAYQKVEPGQGYQFLINMYDQNLRNLLANRPALPNPFLSGPLVENDGKTRCAPECSATGGQTVVEVDCQDIVNESGNTCVVTDNVSEFPNGYSYCECPTTKTHCNPNYKVVNDQCYDLRFPDNAQPQGFPHVTPCSPCHVTAPPLCANLDDPNTPACCFNASYSAANYGGSKACASGNGNYFDWQLGGGRIIVSYVDPRVQDGIPPEFIRNQPKNCTLDPQNCDPNVRATWNAQSPQTGAKIAAIEQDKYAALLEFTVDYFMNLPGPKSYGGPVVFYDVSTVDSLNFPVYMKAVGENKNPQEKCVTNSGQCCLSFIGSPQHYVDEAGGTLKKDCPTDIYASKRDGTTVPWWGNCISAYDYCTNREVGDSGQKPADSKICNVWNAFEQESAPLAKFHEFKQYQPPITDEPTIKRIAGSCSALWLAKKVISKAEDAPNIAANAVMWPNEQTCKGDYIVSDLNNKDLKICCEPRMKDYVNNVIWGCENASYGLGSVSNIKINNEKCRAMNWGVFAPYSVRNEKIVGTTVYEHPAEFIKPERFTCNLESCNVSFANKPYDGSPDSMNCSGASDLSMCCNQTSSPFCWGITVP